MKRIISAVVILIGLTAPAWADMKACQDAYDRKDYTAVKVCRPLAERGDAQAQSNLGVMYSNGEGVRQDYAEALRWYRKAAEQRYAEAQFNLARMYETGRGVRQDYAEAVRWYRKAAERGLARAQYNLGVMYDDGQGVTQDYTQAHKWYNLAASRAESGEVRDVAAKSRNRVGGRLTPAQIAEAQRLARAWQPKPRATKRKFASTRPAPQEPVRKRSTGSGFVVSAEGHILTNRHVVKGCRTILASTAGMVTPAGISVQPKPDTLATREAARGLKVLNVDAQNDLALLKSAKAYPSVVAFRGGRGARTGEDIVVAGFPLHGLLTSDINVTTGTISALAGPGDDRRIFQITAPVQPGNSGGPVLDASGHVVGVVVARLDALKMARRTGRLPQNVNFAISEGAVRAFLDAHDVPYKTARSNRTMPTADIAAKAKGYTVLIECWK